jgi:hypothetical protein
MQQRAYQGQGSIHLLFAFPMSPPSILGVSHLLRDVQPLQSFISQGRNLRRSQAFVLRVWIRYNDTKDLLRDIYNN